jgi:hypothetical protein
MSNLKHILLIVTVILFNGCKKGDSSPDNSVNKQGQAMFWLASDLGCGNITVICNGVSKVIMGYYTTAPTCGANNTATFSLDTGTYSYSASCSGKVWNGSITVTNGECSKMQLTSNGGTNSSGCSSFNLSGTWVRISGGAPGCPGQKVVSTSTTGTTTYTPPGCRFSVNDVTWKNFKASNCTIDVLLKNSDGSGATYESSIISFNSATEIVLGDVVYRKQ